ncbi:MAG: hypothetical protein ACLRIP_12175 [Blautia massiliensis (ex Durand et al. 2017)]
MRRGRTVETWLRSIFKRVLVPNSVETRSTREGKIILERRSASAKLRNGLIRKWSPAEELASYRWSRAAHREKLEVLVGADELLEDSCD